MAKEYEEVEAAIQARQEQVRSYKEGKALLGVAYPEDEPEPIEEDVPDEPEPIEIFAEVEPDEPEVEEAPVEPEPVLKAVEELPEASPEPVEAKKATPKKPPVKKTEDDDAHKSV